MFLADCSGSSKLSKESSSVPSEREYARTGSKNGGSRPTAQKNTKAASHAKVQRDGQGEKVEEKTSAKTAARSKSLRRKTQERSAALQEEQSGSLTNCELFNGQKSQFSAGVDAAQPAAVTGPEASKEMRRAILCLLMYSHRKVRSTVGPLLYVPMHLVLSQKMR